MFRLKTPQKRAGKVDPMIQFPSKPTSDKVMMLGLLLPEILFKPSNSRRRKSGFGSNFLRQTNSEKVIMFGLKTPQRKLQEKVV